MRRSLIVLLLIVSGSSYAAAANKWTDADGKVHYSDQSPPVHAKSKTTLNLNTPDVPVAISGVSGVPVTGKPAKNGDPAKTAVDKKAAADKAAQEAAIKEQNKANCANAKQNLANLNDGMRIAVIDPTTGERSYLDDAQRQSKVNDAQQQISKYCQ